MVDPAMPSLAACGQVYAVRTGPLAALVETPGESAGRELLAELCEVAVAVRLTEQAPLYQLDMGQFGVYQYDAGRGCVGICRPPADPAMLADVLRGPVLLHALAHRGIHVLHASALQQVDGGVLAFTAASGVGKSTFAALAQGLGWRRLADDLLPLGAGSGHPVMALPQLVQPKLAAVEQYPADAPAVPLAALVSLARGADAALRRLSARAAADLFLASTVATRVYASSSLVAHLKFAATLAAAVREGRIQAVELTVPDRPADIRGAVAEALGLLRSAGMAEGSAISG